MALRTFLILFVTCLTFSCDEPGPAPKTQAEFIEAYRSAYNAGDRTAVYRLVKWDGVPNDLRTLHERVLTLGIGEHQITRIEMTDYQPDPNLPHEIDGRKVESNLTPIYLLIAEAEKKEGTGKSKWTSSRKCVVGIDNGVLRFCGMRWGD